METMQQGPNMMEKCARAVLAQDAIRWMKRHVLALTFTLVLVAVNLFSWLIIWFLGIPRSTRMGTPLADLIARQHLAPPPMRQGSPSKSHDSSSPSSSPAIPGS